MNRAHTHSLTYLSERLQDLGVKGMKGKSEDDEPILDDDQAAAILAELKKDIGDASSNEKIGYIISCIETDAITSDEVNEILKEQAG